MKTKSYLALGDSYTIGEAVPQHDSFPYQLCAKMGSIGIDLRPAVVAKTGWTTGELLEAIEERKLESCYHMVTLLIGVNNQYRGMDIQIYKRDFETLLNLAIQFAGGDERSVCVLSIPDWGVTDFGKASGRDIAAIGSEIDAYNKIAQEISGLQNIEFIDITRDSKKAEADKTLIAEDGLHPSAAMYAEWAGALFPFAYNVLKKD